MNIYEMLNELERDDNKSYYGVEPLSYVVLNCGQQLWCKEKLFKRKPKSRRQAATSHDQTDEEVRIHAKGDWLICLLQNYLEICMKTSNAGAWAAILTSRPPHVSILHFQTSEKNDKKQNGERAQINVSALCFLLQKRPLAAHCSRRLQFYAAVRSLRCGLPRFLTAYTAPQRQSGADSAEASEQVFTPLPSYPYLLSCQLRYIP